MKILITGGAGFIGSNLVKKLLEKKFNIVCIDNFDDYYDVKIKKRNIKPFLKEKNFHFYKVDICDYIELKEVFEKEKPKKVCHLAAKVGVRPSIKDIWGYEKVNIGGIINLLELAKKYKVKNFIFTSSSTVYGQSKDLPFRESQNTDLPISPYAATKKAGELLIWNYHHLYNLNATILRLFMVYGPSGRPDMAPFLFTDSIFRGKTISKFGVGPSKRDYIYIDDLIDGLVAAIEKDLKFEIINLGGGHPISLNKLIKLIEKNLKRKAKIKKVKAQPGDMTVTWADISKAKKILGYQPRVSIEEGIKKFVSWYLENWRFYNNKI